MASKIIKALVSNLVLFSILLMFAGPKLANGEVTEAEQIALESFPKLLASPDLTKRIEKHLQAIRAKYPQVANVKHQGKWVPGELLVGGLDADGLDQINASNYGPLKEANQLSTLVNIYDLVFSRPYNPEQLAIEIQKSYPVEYAEPNGTYGTSQTITFKEESSTQFTYTFMDGSGDCPSGCIDKHFWVFSVSDTKKLRVNLENEYDSGNGSDAGIF